MSANSIDEGFDNAGSKGVDNDKGDPPDGLVEMLKRMRHSAVNDGKVSLDALMDAVGRQSFGPIILVVGLIAMSPLSGIPTLPSILGVAVALISVQILFGRDHFWLPQKILQRSISEEKFNKGMDKLAPVARFVDRFTGPRIQFLTKGAGNYMVAAFCVAIGATMPPLEILPFLATTAGAALTMFGLALIARDGLMALIGMAFTGGLIALIVVNWPW